MWLRCVTAMIAFLVQVALQQCKIGNNCTIMDGAKIGGKAFVLVQRTNGSFKKQDQRKVLLC